MSAVRQPIPPTQFASVQSVRSPRPSSSQSSPSLRSYRAAQGSSHRVAGSSALAVALPSSRRQPHPSSRSLSVPTALPTHPPMPLWFKGLVGLQWGLAGAAALLVGGLMVVYSRSVAFQDQWNVVYERQELLLRHERELTAANEALKTQITQQAEQSRSEFQAQKPANTLFLKPAPLRQTLKRPLEQPTVMPTPSQPVGY